MQVCGPQQHQNASTHPEAHWPGPRARSSPEMDPVMPGPGSTGNSSPQLHSRVTRKDQWAWKGATLTRESPGSGAHTTHHVPEGCLAEDKEKAQRDNHFSKPWSGANQRNFFNSLTRIILLDEAKIMGLSFPSFW